MIKLKKNDILKDLSNDIFSSEEQATNLEQPTEANIEDQIFSVETPNDIFVDTPKMEEKPEDNATIDSQLDEVAKPVDMSLQQEIVSEDTNIVDTDTNTNEEVNPKEEINFDKINEMLEEAIQESNKQDEVSLNDINNAIEKVEENVVDSVSLNDINTILENHFNDIETASEVSFNELEEKVVDSNLTEEDALDEVLMDYKDEDITFNDLNNMTQEINLEELNAVLEQIEELDEEKEEQVVEKEEEVKEKVDTTIESTFPKLDKFGSVFPRKSM